MKVVGGYALTHVLVCERADANPFDPATAMDFMPMLDAALSFCLGRWTGGVLATGYDPNGVLSWEQWRLPWLSSDGADRSWFPQFPGAALQTFVPGYVLACEDPVVGRALRTCVHWYIEANACHGGLEGAITMALMGLELLSWLELVVRGRDSPEDFHRAPAHAKIRQYLVAKSVSLDAQALPEVIAFVAEQKCIDGLEAITRIRNRTVHPPKGKFVDYSIDVREQGWRYATYLLERAILAEAGYRGPIIERLGWTDVTL